MADNLTVSVSLTADAKGLQGALRVSKDELAKLAGTAKKTEGDVGRLEGAFTKLKNKLKGVRVDLFSMKSAIASVGFGLLGREIFQAGATMEKLQNGLHAATGTAEGAARELGFLRAESERLGISFTTSAQAYMKLAAAAKGTALAGQEARNIFTAVAEASRVMGLSADEADGALLAISQMMSKGTVQAEELRGQLGERIPGAFQIAARAMNVTTAELGDMLMKGGVLAEDLLPKLAVELRKAVGEGLPNALNSAQAAQERFNNAVFDLKVAVGSGGLLAGMASAFSTMARVLRSTQYIVIEFVDAFARAGAFLQNRWQAVTIAFSSAWQGAVNTATSGWRGFLNLLADGLDALGQDWEADKLRDITRALVPEESATESYKRQMAELAASYKAQLSIMDQVKLEMQDEAAAMTQLAQNVLPPLVNGTKGHAEATKEQKKAIEDATKSLTDMRDELRLQVATFGMNEAAALQYRLTLGDLKDEVALLGDKGKELAAALHDLQLDAMAQQVKDTVDPMQALRREMETLNMLLDEGRLSFDQWAVATMEVQERMDDMNGTADKTEKKLGEFGVQAARNMQDAFSSFLFEPFKNGMDGMLHDFVQAIHKMVSEALAAQLMKKLLGDFDKTGNFGGAAGGLFNSALSFFGLAHTGGLVGGLRSGKSIPALAFAGAPRFHSGGMVGLANNEVPIIAQKGEEVLTRDDPRHRANSGNGGGQGVRIVNVLDPSLVSDFMASSAGERVVLNIVNKYRNTLQGA